MWSNKVLFFYLEITDGIEKSCIFCKSNRKRVKNKEQLLHKITETNFEEFKNSLKSEIYKSVFGDNLKENYFYHGVCKLKFLRDQKPIENEHTASPWHSNRIHHKSCFAIICTVIEKKVLQNNEFISFENIFKNYQSHLFEKTNERSFLSKNPLREKLKARYFDKVSITKVCGKEDGQTLEIIHKISQNPPDYNTAYTFNLLEDESLLLR